MEKISTGLALCLLCFFFVSCLRDHESANLQLAKSWLDALNRHDTVQLAGMYTADAEFESPNWEGKKTGPAAIRTIYYRYFSSTPDLSQQITHIAANDTCLLIEYLSQGTLLNPENNTPDYMRGKKYRLENCTRMTIRNGKITRQKTYFDQVSFLKQVGFFDER